MEPAENRPPVPKPRTRKTFTATEHPPIPPKPKRYIHPNKLKVDGALPKPPERVASLGLSAPALPPRHTENPSELTMCDTVQRPTTKLLDRFRKSAPPEKIIFDIGFSPQTEVDRKTTGNTFDINERSNDAPSFAGNREKIKESLNMSALQIKKPMKEEEIEQVEDKYLTNMNQYIRTKFIDVETMFIDKLNTWKKNTTYDYLKTMLTKEKLDKYFGLINELIELHQEYFFPNFSKCYSISEVCDFFINSETQLKVHILDLWTKNAELYRDSLAKKIHLNGEFYNLPCEQLKIYFREFQELDCSSDLCFEDSKKISLVLKLLTKLLAEWLNVENTLKNIRDETIDLKDIGYMLDREKCSVTVLEDGRKKKLETMDVIFAEKCIILTTHKDPYFHFVEGLPLDKIHVSINFNTALISIVIGQLTKKTYNLGLRNPDTARKLYETIKDFIPTTIIEHN